MNGAGTRPRLECTVEVDPATGQGAITAPRLDNVPERAAPALVARLGYNFGGGRGHDETDWGRGGLRFGVAAAAYVTFDVDDHRMRTQFQLAF